MKYFDVLMFVQTKLPVSQLFIASQENRSARGDGPSNNCVTREETALRQAGVSDLVLRSYWGAASFYCPGSPRVTG